LNSSAYSYHSFQVDYSDGYEKTRVSCGYPRVTGKELARLKSEIASAESDFVRELETDFTLDNLIWGLRLIEKRRECKVKVKSTPSYYQRALCLVLVIRSRLDKEFASELTLIARAKDCLDWLLESIENDSLNLKTDVVMTFELLSSTVCKQSNGGASLDGLSSDELYTLFTGVTDRPLRGQKL
jgi:hypothetical protein